MAIPVVSRTGRGGTVRAKVARSAGSKMGGAAAAVAVAAVVVAVPVNDGPRRGTAPPYRPAMAAVGVVVADMLRAAWPCSAVVGVVVDGVVVMARA